MYLETERLIMRQLTWDDFNSLSQVISDPETMKHYPKPYDESGVNRWIQWNLDNYQKYGFGLLALILKENNQFIGDCGITMQKIHDEIKPEIGYHINKKYHKQGYGTEAAKKCRDYFFLNTTYDAIYSYMDSENEGSYKVAINNGMHLVDEYDDKGEHLLVYRITRSEWMKIKERETFS